MKVKAADLKEQLNKNGIDENLLDKLFKRISRARTNSQIKDLESDIKTAKKTKQANREKLEKLFIKSFGSLKDTPESFLKLLDI